MVKAENATNKGSTNPLRSSRSEYFTGKFQASNLISSPKSSQKASSKPSKRYVVLDDMTVLEVTSDHRKGGGTDGYNTKKNPPRSLYN